MSDSVCKNTTPFFEIRLITADAQPFTTVPAGIP